jgi:cell division protein DivIC
MKIRKETRLKILKNKFVLTSLIFIVWMTFFDQNNIIERVKAYSQFKQLQSDQMYYRDKIKSDSKELEELRTNKDNLEKFAREKYLMKKDNEDIFLVED